MRPLRHSVHTAPAPEGNNLIYHAGAKRAHNSKFECYLINNQVRTYVLSKLPHFSD